MLILAGVVSRTSYLSDSLAVVVDGKDVGLVGVDGHDDPTSRFGKKNARNARFQLHVAVIGRHDHGN